jgi:hypothetical protein
MVVSNDRVYGGGGGSRAKAAADREKKAKIAGNALKNLPTDAAPIANYVAAVVRGPNNFGKLPTISKMT